MWVYIYTEEQEWQPGENTVAYYPLETDANDYSWNNRNPTNIGSAITFGTDSDGNKCANFTTNSNSYIQYWSQWSNINFWTTETTIAFWLEATSNTGSSMNYSNWVLTWQVWWSYSVAVLISATPAAWTVWDLGVNTGGSVLVLASSIYWTWPHCYILTTDTNWDYAIYIDGTLYNSSTTTFSNLSWNNCYMWYDPRDTSGLRHLVWNLRQVVFETKKRTADEALWFYNATK